MKKYPIWYLIIGIIILIVPTGVYLGFLIPAMSETYNVLMASGGVIGGAGFYGASRIPKEVKYSGLFKLAANSFTILTIITLVQEFALQLIGLVAVFVISFIVFIIFKGAWKNGKQRLKDERLATEVARSVVETIK